MLGVLGAGSMGGAIVRGVLASGARPESILVAASSPARSREVASALGVTDGVDARTVARATRGGILLLAVKPYLVESVLESIREELAESGTLVVSVAAAVSLERLEKAAGSGVAVVRTMPNVGASIGMSMTAYACGASCTQEDEERARELLETFGTAVKIAEKDFSIFSALAGCSPAYTCEYIDAMARAGVKNGLPKALATKIAAQAVAGAASLVLAKLNEGISAADVADSVQSPGGTTVAGVVELEQAGFGAGIVRAVQASVDRDRELQS